MWILEKLILKIFHSKKSDTFKITALIKVLNQSKKLDLDGYLDKSRLGDSKIILLVKALEKNRTLVSLNLSFNNIGIEGAKAVAEALKTNQTLTSLKLSGHDVGDEGVKAIQVLNLLTLANLQLRGVTP